MERRMAGDLLGRAIELAQSAAIADLARGHQLHHGRLTYGSIQQLFNDALQQARYSGPSNTRIDEVGIADVRQAAQALLSMRKTMIEDDLGLRFDERGHVIHD